MTQITDLDGCLRAFGAVTLSAELADHREINSYAFDFDHLDSSSIPADFARMEKGTVYFAPAT
ncbi:unnamed protein product, partial [marine sediment metagenome]